MSTAICYALRATLSFLFVVILGLSLLVTPAAAQALDNVTVPINVTVAPGQPIDLFFTEPLDFIHHKDLLFQGVAHVPAGTAGLLDVQFDWLNTANGISLSPVFPVNVVGDTTFLIPFQIPFCPERISLHLTNDGPVPSFPIEVDGKFTYTCIPEPSSLALLSLALAALIGCHFRKGANN